MYADKDAVIVLWDGRGIANDGQLYENSYTWFIRRERPTDLGAGEAPPAFGIETIIATEAFELRVVDAHGEPDTVYCT